MTGLNCNFLITGFFLLVQCRQVSASIKKKVPSSFSRFPFSAFSISKLGNLLSLSNYRLQFNPPRPNFIYQKRARGPDFVTVGLVKSAMQYLVLVLFVFVSCNFVFATGFGFRLAIFRNFCRLCFLQCGKTIFASIERAIPLVCHFLSSAICVAKLCFEDFPR